MTSEASNILNMKYDLDKNLNKNVFHTIKTVIGSRSKSAWNKIVT